jgi:hypothetical protein
MAEHAAVSATQRRRYQQAVAIEASGAAIANRPRHKLVMIIVTLARLEAGAINSVQTALCETAVFRNMNHFSPAGNELAWK